MLKGNKKDKSRTSSKRSEQEIPDIFKCSISHLPFKYPVTTIYGHNFEEEDLIKWLDDNETCPLTRKPLTLKDFKFNKLLQEATQEYLSLHKQFEESQKELVLLDQALDSDNHVDHSVPVSENGRRLI